MRLLDLATRLGVPVDGDGELEVVRAAALETAGPGDLSFVRDVRHARKGAATQAAALVLPVGLAWPPAVDDPPPPRPVALLRTPRVDLVFARAVALLHPRPRPAEGVHPTACVAATARLGPGASVGPYAVIEDDVVVGARAEVGAHVILHRGVVIGDDAVLHSRVTIREGSRLGHRVIVQNGAVIGADGFGYARGEDGGHVKIPQVGIVEIGDDVEIQANSCVDRAALGVTRIGRGVKIDNLVQVGHNSVVGEHSILCGQVGLAGSTVIGKGVMLGGQVGVGGHLTVHDGAAALAQAGISSDVGPGEVVAGAPPLPVRTHHRFQLSIPRLIDVPADLKRLEARVAALEQRPPS